MTDRFKFRVWDNEFKKYRTGLGINNGLVCTYNDDTCVLEQCTGLKDKDGKLIYEGDIVREISKKEPEWEEYITEVKWGKCGFNLYSDEDYDFEIIGNIHENKDLLK